MHHKISQKRIFLRIEFHDFGPYCGKFLSKKKNVYFESNVNTNLL